MSTLLSALPLLLLLACPLMMMVMMRGMGAGHMHQTAPPNEAVRNEDPQITARIAELERELADVPSERDVTAPRRHRRPQ